jgi:hypothetical protein
MDNESSLPCLQEHAAELYLKPTESSPHPHTYFFDRNLIIIRHILAYVAQSFQNKMLAELTDASGLIL